MTCEHAPDSLCECFFCGAGDIWVSALPCQCPTCGEALTKLMCRMSPEELTAALERKYKSSDPMYTLAA